MKNHYMTALLMSCNALYNSKVSDHSPEGIRLFSLIISQEGWYMSHGINSLPVHVSSLATLLITTAAKGLK